MIVNHKLSAFALGYAQALADVLNQIDAETNEADALCAALVWISDNTRGTTQLTARSLQLHYATPTEG